MAAYMPLAGKFCTLQIDNNIGSTDMNIYPALALAAVLGLQACSQEPAASVPAVSAASEPTASAGTESGCTTVIEAGDDMKYNKSEIIIGKTCTEYTITLKHMGTMAKTAMGHNLTIAVADDVEGVVKDGAAAGPENDFIPAGDKRIVAHTKLLGGGEEDTVKVDTAKLAPGGKYEFSCTFPGHPTMMRGIIKQAD